jgi:hypothetical protein
MSRIALARSDVLAVLALLGITLAMRLAFFATWPPFMNLDSEGYYLPAHDILHGRAPDFGLRRSPGYPLFILPIIALVGEDLQRLVTVQHFVLGPLTVLATYGLARCFMAWPGALVAGALIAFSGPQLVFEHYVMTEALYGALLTIGVLAAVVAARREHRWLAIASGLVLGWAVLVRPIGQIVVGLGLVFLFVSVWHRNRSMRRAAMLGAAFVLASAVVVVPWMTYNYLTQGAFVIAHNGRFLLARTIKMDPHGFTFEALPGTVDDPLRAAARRIVQQEAAKDPPGSSTNRLRNELGLSELETFGLMSSLAVEAMINNPRYYLLGSIRFIGTSFAGRPIVVRREGDDWREVDWERRVRPVLQQPVYRRNESRADLLLNLYNPHSLGPSLVILYALGVLLALVGRLPRKLLLTATVPFASIAAAAFVVGSEARFRYPLDPMITVVSVAGVSWLVLSVGRALRRLATVH